MKKIFDVKEVDKRVYQEKLQDTLPEKIIDIHTHVYLEKSRAKSKKRVVKWPSLVANENPVEHLLETYRLMFPGKKVTPLLFNSPSADADTDVLNNYVKDSAKRFKLPSLMLSKPEWTEKELSDRLEKGGFLGIKPYLTFAPDYIPQKEIRIFDFVPHSHLRVINSRKKILMLHIPRDERLRDPVNLMQMTEIENRYPDIKLIIAHVGRAYCPSDVGNAFEILGKTKKMLFDISANTNAVVFKQLIETVGAERILFGSDLPITRMRMRRICEKGRYINIVPPGLYGDVSGDKNMREAKGSDSQKLTFFLYEEILAFIRAAKSAGLRSDDIEKVFYSNAASMLEEAAKPVKLQLHMVLPEDQLEQKPLLRMPAGYSLRTYRKGDEKRYIRVMRKAGFENWDYTESVLRTALPEGIFFAIHDRTKKIVATACAQNVPSKLHPQGGVLGWVAVDPAHRGKKLGYIVSSASVERLKKAGYRRISLSTDDWRLAAIKTYLNMGFVPLYYKPDMKKRWNEILKLLGAKSK